MSKAIEVAQLKSRSVGLLMLLVYILVGYQINATSVLSKIFWLHGFPPSLQ